MTTPATATDLAHLPVDGRATITGFADDCPARVRQRLASLGFTFGTPVGKRRRAPLGDPSVYEVLGYQICLRDREARLIRCTPTQAGAIEGAGDE
ncbi:MAG: FeoA family protein [Gordonia sp. (in: high G+C Gram-positive bacteria)]